MSNAACDILLVEDDPSDADFLKRALLKVDAKATLQVLVDGHQAITYLSQNNGNGSLVLPSLVITDLKMPKVNGHELIKWMRSRPSLAQLPIVVLSSSEMQQDIDLAIDLGATAYIQKPLGIVELEKIVQSLVASWLNRDR
jgi:two-component system, chemotaxis family, response regulator Rcp1